MSGRRMRGQTPERVPSFSRIHEPSQLVSSPRKLDPPPTPVSLHQPNASRFQTPPRGSRQSSPHKFKTRVFDPQTSPKLVTEKSLEKQFHLDVEDFEISRSEDNAKATLASDLSKPRNDWVKNVKPAEEFKAVEDVKFSLENKMDVDVDVEQDMDAGTEEKIYVTVRMRPLSHKEISQRDRSVWRVTDLYTLQNSDPSQERTPYPSSYQFDRVFGPDCPSQKVYIEGAKDVVLSALAGINASIFAYGMTSSGKTYTMKAITEFAVRDIFEYIRNHPEREFMIRVSALEIYNEVVKDLLNADNAPLRLWDDPERGTVVERLTEEVVVSSLHLSQLLAECEAQRQVGETMLNDASSRSHQIVRLTVESCPRSQNNLSSSLDTLSTKVLSASLNFVDLAGSERVSQTQAEGTRLKEGGHINRSLLTLGTVIRKLSGGNKVKTGHIPYRDSKLTRILQHSLGGNGRTAIICTISPALSHVDQTRNTLSFATRAKEVTNNAQINVTISEKILVKQLKAEVARLEQMLKSAPSLEELENQTLLIQKLKSEIGELTRQRDAAQAQIQELSRSLALTESKFFPQIQTSISGKRQSPENEIPPRRKSKKGNIKFSSNLTLTSTSQSTSIPFHTPMFPNPLNSDENNPWQGNVFTPSESWLLGEGAKERRRFRKAITKSSLTLLREIRKLEHMQDELGEDASRAMEALQKEIECLRLAQLGMNQEAADTIAKLQAEVQGIRAAKSSKLSPKESPGRRNNKPLQSSNNSNSSGNGNNTTISNSVNINASISNETSGNNNNTNNPPPSNVNNSINNSVNTNVNNANNSVRPISSNDNASRPVTLNSLRSEISRLSTSQQDDKTDFAIASLEEKLDSVQNSLNNMYAYDPTAFSSSEIDRLMNLKGKTAAEIEGEDRGRNEGDSLEGEEKGLSIADSSSSLNDAKSLNREDETHVESPSAIGNQLDVAGELRKDSSQDVLREGSGNDVDEMTALDIRRMQLLFKSAAEENIKSIRNYVNDLKERVAKLHYQKQILVCQVLELEANKKQSEESDEEEEEQSDGTIANPSSSASPWSLQFQKRITAIILLWDRCHVSLVHRTQFFLLIKGEPTDMAYLEVEHRRMTWLWEQCQHDRGKISSVYSAYVREVKRERELIARRMRVRLSREERENLYSQWGVPEKSKQRKLQLSLKLWSDPHDMRQVKMSARLVGHLMGLIDSNACKQMFELRFSPLFEQKCATKHGVFVV